MSKQGNKEFARAISAQEAERPDPAILTGPAGSGVTAQAQRLARVMGLRINRRWQPGQPLERGVLHCTTAEHGATRDRYHWCRVVPFAHALRAAAEFELCADGIRLPSPPAAPAFKSRRAHTAGKGVI